MRAVQEEILLDAIVRGKFQSQITVPWPFWIFNHCDHKYIYMGSVRQILEF